MEFLKVPYNDFLHSIALCNRTLNEETYHEDDYTDVSWEELNDEGLIETIGYTRYYNSGEVHHFIKKHLHKSKNKGEPNG